MDGYIERLRTEDLNLIIVKDDETLYTSSKIGMLPLFEAIKAVGLPTLKDSIVVDKVMGKASALLVSYFKAKEVHCVVLSRRAIGVLDRQGVKYYSERLTPEIANKFGTDICPFEKRVLDVDDPTEGYERLSIKMDY